MAGFFYCSNAELSGVHELVRVLFEFLFTLTGAEIRRLPAFIRFEFTLLVHFHATNRIDHKLLLRSMIRWIEEAFAGMAADRSLCSAADGLLQISEQVVGVLESDGEPQQVGRGT